MNGFWQQNIASGEENRRFTYVHNRAVGGSENPGGIINVVGICQNLRGTIALPAPPTQDLTALFLVLKQY